MRISCDLNNLNNIKVLSYILPNCFDNIVNLRQSKNFDIQGTLIAFLDRNHDFSNSQILNGQYIIELDEQEIDSKFDSIDHYKLSEVNLSTNSDGQFIVKLITDEDIHYDCSLINLKTKNKVNGLECQLLYGNQTELVLVSINSGICYFIDKSEETLKEKIWQIV